MKAQGRPIPTSDVVRVRIPPSPTGDPHLGTAYMAVFNYIFAKKRHGTVILRFEDTDAERNVEGSEEAIMQGLEWLGIKWDEGPYRQSERLDVYRQHAQELVGQELAYEDKGAIFLRVGDDGDVSFTDLSRGEIITPKKEIKDQVLIKSDGVATYNFAVVVDDAIIDKISHVIRGEIHISNTPKQVLMYEALGKPLPQFAHFPHIKGENGEKLSKRHGARSVLEMRAKGFLPEALVNYLILLGWTHPEEKEVFTLEEAAKLFELATMHQSSPTFDLEKLKWLNGQWINRLDPAALASQTEERFFPFTATEPKLADVVPLVRERMRTLAEFEELTHYFFAEEIDVEPKLLAKYITDDQARQEFLLSVLRNLSNLEDKKWAAETLEKTLRAVQQDHNLSPKQAFMTLRVALTGQTATPGLFETIEVLGKQKTLKRLHQAAD